MKLTVYNLGLKKGHLIETDENFKISNFHKFLFFQTWFLNLWLRTNIDVLPCKMGYSKFSEDLA